MPNMPENGKKSGESRGNESCNTTGGQKSGFEGKHSQQNFDKERENAKNPQGGHQSQSNNNSRQDFNRPNPQGQQNDERSRDNNRSPDRR